MERTFRAGAFDYSRRKLIVNGFPRMQSSFERVAESGFADAKQSKKIRRRKGFDCKPVCNVSIQ